MRPLIASMDLTDLGNPIYSDIEIETKVGHAIGLGLGRRWQNFEGEIHFSYASVGYDSASAADGSFAASVPVSGEVELFQIGARAGYGIACRRFRLDPGCGGIRIRQKA